MSASRGTPNFSGMEGEPLPPGPEGVLSSPLASAYLAEVCVLWLATIAVVVLAIVTGRTSWTTHNLWIVVVGFVVIIAAIAVVRLVDQQLTGDTPGAMQGVRWLGLAYGSAFGQALRSLRHSSGTSSPSP